MTLFKYTFYSIELKGTAYNSPQTQYHQNKSIDYYGVSCMETEVTSLIGNLWFTVTVRHTLHPINFLNQSSSNTK